MKKPMYLKSLEDPEGEVCSLYVKGHRNRRKFLKEVRKNKHYLWFEYFDGSEHKSIIDIPLTRHNIIHGYLSHDTDYYYLTKKKFEDSRQYRPITFIDFNEITWKRHE